MITKFIATDPIDTILPRTQKHNHFVNITKIKKCSNSSSNDMDPGHTIYVWINISTGKIIYGLL